MSAQLTVAVEAFPIAGRFVISRGAKTQAVVVTATLRAGGAVGRGECVPYARYGESAESVVAAIEGVRARTSRPGPTAPRCSACCRRARRATRWTAPCGIWRPSARASRRIAAAGFAALAPLDHRLHALGRDARGNARGGGARRASTAC